jgi:hypothetical protein
MFKPEIRASNLNCFKTDLTAAEGKEINYRKINQLLGLCSVD